MSEQQERDEWDRNDPRWRGEWGLQSAGGNDCLLLTVRDSISQGEITSIERILDSGIYVPELEAENARLREALEGLQKATSVFASVAHNHLGAVDLNNLYEALHRAKAVGENAKGGAR